MRLLGIPTVVDRMIQQAIAQVLTPIYERQFSQGSFGFRPNRGAKQALVRVTEIVGMATAMRWALTWNASSTR